MNKLTQIFELALLFVPEDKKHFLKQSFEEELRGPKPPPTTLVSILRGISSITGIPESEIIGRNRVQELVDARRIYCHLARKHTDKTLYSIGRLIKRDHSTVLYYDNTAQNLIKTDKDFRELASFIEREIFQTQ